VANLSASQNISQVFIRVIHSALFIQLRFSSLIYRSYEILTFLVK